MKVNLIKRTIFNGAGNDVSLIPAFPSDEKTIGKMGAGEIIEFEVIKMEKDLNLKKFKALTRYFYHNCPEEFHKLDDVTWQPGPVWGSVKVLELWLAVEVGWCNLVKTAAGDAVQIPRGMDFKSEPDRFEVNAEYFEPAIKKLADMIGMEVFDLVNASVNHSKELNK